MPLALPINLPMVWIDLWGEHISMVCERLTHVNGIYAFDNLNSLWRLNQDSIMYKARTECKLIWGSSRAEEKEVCHTTRQNAYLSKGMVVFNIDSEDNNDDNDCNNGADWRVSDVQMHAQEKDLFEENLLCIENTRNWCPREITW